MLADAVDVVRERLCSSPYHRNAPRFNALRASRIVEKLVHHEQPLGMPASPRASSASTKPAGLVAYRAVAARRTVELRRERVALQPVEPDAELEVSIFGSGEVRVLREQRVEARRNATEFWFLPVTQRQSSFAPCSDTRNGLQLQQQPQRLAPFREVGR